MLLNKTFLVTAGPTHEAIDPVRYIGNHSTGKMGYAIVDELINQGANVILVTGPTSLTPNPNATTEQVTSAQQMYEAVMQYVEKVDAYILSAAVADYTPITVASQKIKKNSDTFSIELKKTIDIAKTLGQQKRVNQLAIGFALETNNEEENARKKLASKNLDFIVLNSMQNKGTCFGSDNNKITIIDKETATEFKTKSKTDVAKDIVNYVGKLFQKNSVQ